MLKETVEDYVVEGDSMFVIPKRDPINHRSLQITHEVNRYKCDCQFVWCCQLQCNECIQHRWVSTCT